MNYRTLIVSVLVTGFIIIGASIVVGINTRDLTVSDDPYQDGLKFDETLRKKAELGWTVTMPDSLRLGDNALYLSLSGREDKELEGCSVELTASPLGVPETRKSICSALSNGRYRANMVFDRKGYWDITVKVSRDNITLSFSNKINIGG